MSFSFAALLPPCCRLAVEFFRRDDLTDEDDFADDADFADDDDFADVIDEAEPCRVGVFFDAASFAPRASIPVIASPTPGVNQIRNRMRLDPVLTWSATSTSAWLASPYAYESSSEMATTAHVTSSRVTQSLMVPVHIEQPSQILGSKQSQPCNHRHSMHGCKRTRTVPYWHPRRQSDASEILFKIIPFNLMASIFSSDLVATNE